MASSIWIKTVCACNITSFVFVDQMIALPNHWASIATFVAPSARHFEVRSAFVQLNMFSISLVDCNRLRAAVLYVS